MELENAGALLLTFKKDVIPNSPAVVLGIYMTEPASLGGRKSFNSQLIFLALISFSVQA